MGSSVSILNLGQAFITIKCKRFDLSKIRIETGYGLVTEILKQISIVGNAYIRTLK